MMGRGEFDFMFTNHNFQSEFDSLGYQGHRPLGRRAHPRRDRRARDSPVAA